MNRLNTLLTLNPTTATDKLGQVVAGEKTIYRGKIVIDVDSYFESKTSFNLHISKNNKSS